jgi:transcription antitermination factor NusG
VSQIGGALFMNVEGTKTTGTPTHMSCIAAVVRSWFAVHTRPRYERKVHSELQEKGLQSFLPLHSETHQWSDRRRVVELPLFPGYIFVRVTPSVDDRVRVLRTNGVINFVGARNIGVPIPDSEIDSVQSVVKSGLPFKPYPHLEIGQRVYVRGGCLDGIQGVLTAVNGDRGLVVSVNLIQRSIAMRIEGFKVEAA